MWVIVIQQKEGSPKESLATRSTSRRFYLTLIERTGRRLQHRARAAEDAKQLNDGIPQGLALLGKSLENVDFASFL